MGSIDRLGTRYYCSAVGIGQIYEFFWKMVGKEAYIPTATYIVQELSRQDVRNSKFRSNFPT